MYVCALCIHTYLHVFTHINLPFKTGPHTSMAAVECFSTWSVTFIGWRISSAIKSAAIYVTWYLLDFSTSRANFIYQLYTWIRAGNRTSKITAHQNVSESSKKLSHAWELKISSVRILHHRQALYMCPTDQLIYRQQSPLNRIKPNVS